MSAHHLSPAQQARQHLRDTTGRYATGTTAATEPAGLHLPGGGTGEAIRLRSEVEELSDTIARLPDGLARQILLGELRTRRDRLSEWARRPSRAGTTTRPAPARGGEQDPSRRRINPRPALSRPGVADAETVAMLVRAGFGHVRPAGVSQDGRTMSLATSRPGTGRESLTVSADPAGRVTMDLMGGDGPEPFDRDVARERLLADWPDADPDARRHAQAVADAAELAVRHPARPGLPRHVPVADPAVASGRVAPARVVSGGVRFHRVDSYTSDFNGQERYMRIQADRPISDAEIEHLSGLVGYAATSTLRGQPGWRPVRDSPSSFVADYDLTRSRRGDIPVALSDFSVRLNSDLITDGSPVRRTDRSGPGTAGTRLVPGMGASAPGLTPYFGG